MRGVNNSFSHQTIWQAKDNQLKKKCKGIFWDHTIFCVYHDIHTYTSQVSQMGNSIKYIEVEYEVRWQCQTTPVFHVMAAVDINLFVKWNMPTFQFWSFIKDITKLYLLCWFLPTRFIVYVADKVTTYRSSLNMFVTACCNIMLIYVQQMHPVWLHLPLSLQSSACSPSLHPWTPSLCSFSFSPAWQFHVQDPLSSVSSILLSSQTLP